MDTIFLEIAKSSPMLGLMVIFWFYQRKDYQGFVTQVQQDNAKREASYQCTIDKLTEKMGVIENVQCDVKEIKNHIFKD